MEPQERRKKILIMVKNNGLMTGEEIFTSLNDSSITKSLIFQDLELLKRSNLIKKRYSKEEREKIRTSKHGSKVQEYDLNDKFREDFDKVIK